MEHEADEESPFPFQIGKDDAPVGRGLGAAVASLFRSAKYAHQMDSRGRLSLQFAAHLSARQNIHTKRTVEDACHKAVLREEGGVFARKRRKEPALVRL